VIDSFPAYEVTGTLEEFTQYLQGPGVIEWLNDVSTRSNRQEFPLELNGTDQVKYRIKNWKKAVELPVPSTCHHIVEIHVMPGTDISEKICSSVGSKIPQNSWKECFMFAPLCPHPQSTEDPINTFIKPIQLGTKIVFLIAHSNPEGTTIIWPPSKPSGLHYPLRILASLKDIILALIGNNRSIIVIILSCGLSKEQVFSLQEVSHNTHCAIISSMDPCLRYESVLESSVDEFSQMVVAAGLVAESGDFKEENNFTQDDCLPISFSILKEMGDTILVKSAMKQHPPILIYPDCETSIIGSIQKFDTQPLPSLSTTTDSIPVHDNIVVVKSGISDNSAVPPVLSQSLVFQPSAHISSLTNRVGRLNKIHSPQLSQINILHLYRTSIKFTAYLDGEIRTLLFSCEQWFGPDWRKKIKNIGRNCKKLWAISVSDINDLVSLANINNSEPYSCNMITYDTVWEVMDNKWSQVVGI
jgi:hypothetical protein